MNPSTHQPRIGVAAILSLALAFAAFAGSASPVGAIGLDEPSGLSRLLAAYQPTASVRGIATFDAIPTAAQADALRPSACTCSAWRTCRWQWWRAPSASCRPPC